MRQKEATTREEHMRRKDTIGLLLSGVGELSISVALFASSPSPSSLHRTCHRRLLSGRFPPFMTPQSLHDDSRLQAIPDVDNSSIMNRHDFLADAFWSTTSSSFTIASASTSKASTPSTNGPSITTNPVAQNADSLCKNGALMGESAVPGAYSSACMGLAERVVPLPRYRERLLVAMSKRAGGESGIVQAGIRNDFVTEPGLLVVQQKAGGSGSTGMTVWNSGLLLTRLLDAMVDELQRRQRQGVRGSKPKNDIEDDNIFWRNQDVMELGCGTGLCSIAAHRLGAKSVVATDGNPRVLQLEASRTFKSIFFS